MDVLNDAAMPAQEQTNLRDHWHVLVRRKWSGIAFVFIALLITAVGSFLATPVYRASLLLQIEREPVKVVQYQDVTPVEASHSEDFYQTQFELLKSRTLAERVIKQLDLERHPAFTKQSSIFDVVRDWLRNNSGFAPGADESALNGDLIDAFLEHATVAPIKNSRLIRLHFDSADAALAAKIVNALAENFIDINLERRFEATSYAKRFLEERLAQMQAKLEYSEEKLVQFARENGIVNLDVEHSIDLQKLQEMNLVLTQAETQRIAAETAYRQARANPGGTFPAILNNPLVQQLKQYKASLEAQYRDKLKLFKPAYPAMQQLAEQIDEVQRQIVAEGDNIRQSLQREYEIALNNERLLRTRMMQLSDEVLAFQDRSIQYNIFRREVETNRELYNGLLQRMKEVGVAGGISANNISVIDPARLPEEPHSPLIALNLLIAVILGVFGGVGLAFLLEHLDDTVKHPEDLERLARIPVFGAVPQVTSAEELHALGLLSHTEPTSALAEAYRSVRTALLFSTPAGAPKMLLFTSPSPGEGKTTSALNVAISFTQTGHKVLLIDADLRKPSLHRLLRLENGRGLTNYLVGDGSPADISQYGNVPGLFVVTSGPQAPNPAELLSNVRMAQLLASAEDRFDYIILDGPPVLGLADALVLANHVYGTLIVSEAGVTRRGHLVAALKRLESAKATVMGAILSKINAADAGYGYYANYYYYQPVADAKRQRRPA